MLTHLWIKAHGGWYAHRERALKAQWGPWRRLQVRIHQHYNNMNCGYVSTTTTFAGPPVLFHSLHGIHIAPGVHIGHNVTIMQNVSLARTAGTGPYAGQPVIEDNVFLGAGVIVLGNVVVGKNAIIGAGATISRDVPEGATVVSAPVRYLDRVKSEREVVAETSHA
jgi:serine O-acetyltransferase